MSSSASSLADTASARYSTGATDVTLDDFAIIDIRRREMAYSVHDEMLASLQPSDGEEKKIPSLLLWDEMGLKLFEEITFLEEYYLTNVELGILQTWAMEIVKYIKPDSMIVELGSGNLRKTEILLNALETSGHTYHYFALDISFPELVRTLSAVPTYTNISKTGVYGTYDDGLEWLKGPENQYPSKCIWSLGSSLGNFTPTEAEDFLKSWAEFLQPDRDTLLIGLDGCWDPNLVRRAYNDSGGITRKFVLNGLVHANRILEDDIFGAGDWEYISEYDELESRHIASCSPSKDFTYGNISIKSGEKVLVGHSYKYSSQQRDVIWARAGLVECGKWSNISNDIPYGVHMLYPRVRAINGQTIEKAVT